MGELLLEHSVPLLFLVLACIFMYDEYKKHFKVIQNTDNINLVTRYVELQRIKELRKKAT